MTEVVRKPARRPYGRIFAAARRLGLSDEQRRAAQAALVGESSLTRMTAEQVRRVEAHFEAQLAPLPAPAATDTPPDTPQGRKLRALWISAWLLGIVNDRSDRALAAWIRRQTHLKAARWAVDARQCANVIEALLAWIAREAGVDWSPYRVARADGPPVELFRPAARVIEAQWRILRKLGELRGPVRADSDALHRYASRWAGGAERGLTQLSQAELHGLSARLAVWIRKARGKAAAGGVAAR